MNRLTLILICAIGLSGCAVPATQQEIASASFAALPKDYEQQIKSVMSSGLKDPYSAVYRFEIPRRGFVQDGVLRGGKKHFGWIVTVYVNAKNAFGGYVGEEPYQYIFTEGKIAPAGESFALHLAGYI